MSESIILPCGCQFNETAVLAMCGRHVIELHHKNAKREASYAEYRRLMERMAPPPPRRSGES